MYDHAAAAKTQAIAYANASGECAQAGSLNRPPRTSEDIFNRLVSRIHGFEMLAVRASDAADRLTGSVPMNPGKTDVAPSPVTLMQKLAMLEQGLGLMESRLGDAIERIESFA